MMDTYKFGTKNNWRRQIWNELSKRTSKDAIILYLSGREDLDRPVAVAHGFKPWNLIAVDKDESVVNDLRSQGKLAIKGNLEDVLKSWKNSTVVPQIILADFTSGLTDDAMATIASTVNLTDLTEKQIIICANLLRGRKESSIRATLSELFSKETEDKKISHHRGFILFHTIVEIIGNGWGYLPRLTAQEIDRMFTIMNPRFYSYKSIAGSQHFDSSLFTWPTRYEFKGTRPDGKLTKEIAACLAVRTMRKNGTLKRCPND